MTNIKGFSSESDDSSLLGFFSSSSSSEDSSNEEDDKEKLENHYFCNLQDGDNVEINETLNSSSVDLYNCEATKPHHTKNVLINLPRIVPTCEITTQAKAVLDECDTKPYDTSWTNIVSLQKHDELNLNSSYVTGHENMLTHSNNEIKHFSSAVFNCTDYSASHKNREGDFIQPQFVSCNKCLKPIEFLNIYNGQTKSHKENETCNTRKNKISSNNSYNKKLYSCTLCEATFENKIECHQHKLKHAKKSLHKCKICDKEFQRSYQLVSHLQVHRGGKHFECKQCGCFYAYRTSLLRHNSKYHSENSKTFQCDQCGEMFLNRRLLNSHVVLHTAKKIIKCIECNRMFKYYSSLKRHKIQMHQGIKPYKCLYCSKTFRSLSYLKIHAGLHDHK